MKTTFTTLLLALSCFLGKTIACDCIPIPDFCQTITYGNDGEIFDWVNIYHIKVIAEAADGIMVSVLKNYHGEDLTGQDIFIMDGNGGDCRLFATYYFNVGDEAIIAASKFDSTWSVSECGVTYLKVINGQVTGEFSPGVTQIPLENFQAALADCTNLNPTNEPKDIQLITVLPTLAYDQVYIRLNGFPTDITLRVYDPNGRLVHQTTMHQGASFPQNQVSMSGWVAGVYFFKIEGAGQTATFRVVKMGGR